MGGTYTFTFTERDLSILQDALDWAVEEELITNDFGRADFIELAEAIAQRLAW